MLGRAMAKGTKRKSRPAVRCAIYTRKSSDEGLEQAFNSLDTQRETCEALILRQMVSALVSTRRTPGASFAAEESMVRISAWAWGERRMWPWAWRPARSAICPRLHHNEFSTLYARARPVPWTARCWSRLGRVSERSGQGADNRSGGLTRPRV